ncbi:hypothetical protein G7Y89_g10945 [Cudoniella acicularis]|uniref:SNF2 N-terminal domain-containing protein n=1 Tax=Cudoniella acicularis TaxID=354080 RepID=A0A8H4RDA5_9HELO|nr:hypothetical protein G7Y89_g10945 [Cudoniella acicularis]
MVFFPFPAFSPSVFRSVKLATPTNVEVQHFTTTQDPLDRYSASAPSLEYSCELLDVADLTNSWVKGFFPTYDLYQHQAIGCAYLAQKCINNGGGITADEMGMRKTIQVLGLTARILDQGKDPDFQKLLSRGVD